jgi:hypothetical protein
MGGPASGRDDITVDSRKSSTVTKSEKDPLVIKEKLF